MKTKMMILIMTLSIGGTQAYATAKACTAGLPSSCEILGSQIIGDSGTTVFGLSVDCKLRDGNITKYVETITLKGFLGRNIEAKANNLPSVFQIIHRTDDNPGMVLKCQ